MKIVVIGGSGLIGKKLVRKLQQLGHEAVAASLSSGVNAVTGEGLAEVLVGQLAHRVEPFRGLAQPFYRLKIGNENSMLT